MTYTRRALLQGVATFGSEALALRAAPSWNAGSVVHLLPTVNHNRILLKASFENPQPAPPRLHAGGKFFTGERTDRRGQFWCFDATPLEPARPYQLELSDARGRRLCDPWRLKTFPAPSDQPRRLRL